MPDFRMLGVRPDNRPALGTVDLYECGVVDLGVVGEVEVESDGAAGVDVEDEPESGPNSVPGGPISNG